MFVTLLGLAGCQISPAPKNPSDTLLRITIAYGPTKGCEVRFEDKKFFLPADEDPLRNALAKLIDRYRKVVVKGDGRGYEDIPYRCFGHTIFVAQRAGFEDVGFISEPPPTHE